MSRNSRLVLASASPQRRALLAGLGIAFDVIPSSIEEDHHPEDDPRKRAQDLARLKARDIAKKNPDAFVIGCDTLVVADVVVETRESRVSTTTIPTTTIPKTTIPTMAGMLLEKPKNEADARRMIAMQSGTTSIVHSALCVIDPRGKLHEGISSSTVTFKKLTPKEIDWWISSGLWRDRSGGFQIDGLGQLMIASITGDWTGVVGLPVFLLGGLLEEAEFLFREGR